MIKFFNALPAHLAVESPYRFNNLAIEAKVLKVYVFIITDFEYFNPIKSSNDIARMHIAAEEEEYKRGEYDYDCHQI